MRTIRTAASHAIILSYVNGKAKDLSADVDSYSIGASIYGNSSCTLSVKYKTASYDAILRNANVDGTGPFALRSFLSVFVHHPVIDDLYVEAFFGEIKGYGASMQQHDGNISVLAVGFLDAANKVMLPVSMPAASAGITMDVLINNATGGTNFNKPDTVSALRSTWSAYTAQQAETTTLETYIGLLKALVDVADLSGTHNYKLVKDRIALLGEVHEEPQKGNLILGKLLASKTEIVSLGSALQSAAQYMMGECFSGLDGSVIVKPSMWNCGIPKSHFIHAAFIQSFSTEVDLTKRITRALVYGSVSSVGYVGQQENSSAIYENVMVPVVFVNDTNGVSATASIMANTTDIPVTQTGGSDAEGNTVMLESTSDMSDFEKKFSVQAVVHHAPQLCYPAGCSQPDYCKNVGLPFARFLIDSMNLAVDTSTTVLKPGMPWIKPGFNMAVDPGGVDKVYYVVSVQTSGSPNVEATTVISGSAGCTLSGADFKTRLANDKSHACSWLKINEGKVATYAGALQTDASGFGSIQEWYDAQEVL